MTTIVAKQFDDRVEFIADSQVTLNSGRIMRHVKMSKIVERNGYVIAGAGDVAPCDIAQHIWNPPKPTAIDKKDLYHFVISKVVPSLKQCLEDNKYPLERVAKDPDAGFDLLIALCGEVFYVADDGSVLLDESGLYVIGSGSTTTFGALKYGATIDEAMSLAIAGDAYTSESKSSPLVRITQRK